MNTSLELLREKIDILDAQLIASLGETPSRSSKKIPVITSIEYEQLLQTGLHFSPLTWKLLIKRFKISQQIGTYKKQMGFKNILDEARKNEMIKSRILWAPNTLKRPVKEFYEIVHDISVRIQSEILENSIATLRSGQ